MCVAFRIGFYGVFADSRLFAHASLDLHLYFSSVRGWGGGWGGGGVMTSMRMHLVSSVSFVDIVLVCSSALHWWGEGGDGGGGDDVHANAASVLCFSCCFVF